MRLLRPGASYEQLRSEFRHRVRDQVRGEVPKAFVLLNLATPAIPLWRRRSRPL